MYELSKAEEVAFLEYCKKHEIDPLQFVSVKPAKSSDGWIVEVPYRNYVSAMADRAERMTALSPENIGTGPIDRSPSPWWRTSWQPSPRD